MIVFAYPAKTRVVLFLPVKDDGIHIIPLVVARMVFYAKLNSMLVLLVLFRIVRLQPICVKCWDYGLFMIVFAYPSDVGYFSKTNLMLFEDALLDPFWATKKMMPGRSSFTVCGRPPNGTTPKEPMIRKLSSKRGQKIYSKRKSTVEPVFGQIRSPGA